MRRLNAASAFGPLWHETCWVRFLTASDEDARCINEFGKQIDSAMPDVDAPMDGMDENMEYSRRQSAILQDGSHQQQPLLPEKQRSQQIKHQEQPKRFIA